MQYILVIFCRYDRTKENTNYKNFVSQISVLLLRNLFKPKLGLFGEFLLLISSLLRLVAEVHMEKKMKNQKAKSKSSEARKQLSSVRVIQRNLVYIVGLPLNLADEDVKFLPHAFNSCYLVYLFCL